jgi:release factor glutamine methyltransferase
MSVAHPLPRTFEEALKMTQQILASSGFMQSRGGIESEAEQLVIGAFRIASGRGRSFSRNDLYVRVLESYPKEAGEKLIAFSQARARGEPLQYLLGYQFFLHHEYSVSPAVLIPRPETEILVFEVVQWFKRSIHQPTQGVEVGLGCGCISIELLKLFPELKMRSSELSDSAIAVAEINVQKILGSKDRIEIIKPEKKSHVLEPFLNEGSLVDFIVSNPPYLVNENEVDPDVLKYEPKSALFAPEDDPLYFYRHIVDLAPMILKEKGVIFFECAHERIQEVSELFNSEWTVELIQDLNGRDRILRAEWVTQPAPGYLN